MKQATKMGSANRSVRKTKGVTFSIPFLFFDYCRLRGRARCKSVVCFASGLRGASSDIGVAFSSFRDSFSLCSLSLPNAGRHHGKISAKKARIALSRRCLGTGKPCRAIHNKAIDSAPRSQPNFLVKAGMAGDNCRAHGYAR